MNIKAIYTSSNYVLYEDNNDNVFFSEKINANSYIKDIIDKSFSKEIMSDNELLDLYSKLRKDELKNKISNYLDNSAKEKGYDDIKSAALRAAIPRSRYYQEGVKFSEWMDNVWAYYDDQMVIIESGQRSFPSIDEFLNELPKINI